MTREEFNKILSEETDKEIKHVIESIDFSNKDQDEILTESVAIAIAASNNIILSVLEKAGVLTYEN
ncbi:MAG: hypothetical protein UC771_14930 [Faecalibacterium sp.]|jgi:hypothetical protein|nr:hypothetical protein [Faecalibacterium sp.]DAX17559.1 MAG TPA: hypothetical protein [Caudoviricetes sp.]